MKCVAVILHQAIIRVPEKRVSVFNCNLGQSSSRECKLPDRRNPDRNLQERERRTTPECREPDLGKFGIRLKRDR
jgi:hypothetical protein